MKTIIRNSAAWLGLFSVVVLGAACDGTDATEDTSGGGVEVAPESPSDPTKKKPGDPAGSADTAPEAASAMEAFKKMAALKGIHIGEVPDGFPLEFLPLYPGGEIDKSAVKDGTVTLLQVVPADKDTVFAWYEGFYTNLGWSAGDPITVVGRTMAGFQGKDAKVDMTLMDRDGDKTFVALALSRK